MIGELRKCLSVVVAIIFLLPIVPSFAETLVVALGASNTAGKGVGKAAAWPAKMEAVLRAKGYDVRVINAGISGDDVSRMRKRLDSSVPEGTDIVILDKGKANNKKRGIDVKSNVVLLKNACDREE